MASDIRIKENANIGSINYVTDTTFIKLLNDEIIISCEFVTPMHTKTSFGIFLHPVDEGGQVL